MARALRVFAAALGLLLSAVALGLGAAPGTAHALDAGRGRAGFCPNGNGVTVVVDFRDLGGTTIVRCAVGSQASGLAALKAAGIDVTGTNRWGESFICRLEGKPGTDREPCIDTPPTKAYWSYWHAPNGGAWTYSQQGATYRTPPTGSFEGWSFSLNREADEAPSPRVAPRRPVSGGSGPGGSGGSGGSGSTGGGNSGGGVGGSPGGGTGAGAGDTLPGTVAGPGQDARPQDGDLPDEEAEKDKKKNKGEDGKKKGKGSKDSKAKKSATPTPSGSPSPVITPSEAADWTGGDDKRTVEAAESSGAPTGTLLGIAAAVMLASGAGFTAWRRRRAVRAGDAA